MKEKNKKVFLTYELVEKLLFLVIVTFRYLRYHLQEEVSLLVEKSSTG